MKTTTINGIRFIVNDGFTGSLMIQAPQSQVSTTMDGLASITIDAETIVSLVSKLYVKPSLIKRIEELPDREALTGTV